MIFSYPAFFPPFFYYLFPSWFILITMKSGQSRHSATIPRFAHVRLFYPHFRFPCPAMLARPIVFHHKHATVSGMFAVAGTRGENCAESCKNTRRLAGVISTRRSSRTRLYARRRPQPNTRRQSTRRLRWLKYTWPGLLSITLTFPSWSRML